MKPTRMLTAALAATLTVAIANGAAAVQILPGEVIYDYTTNGYVCDPDDWNFFGPVTTDFGWDPGAEDGSGAFVAGDWTTSPGWGMGAGVGIGPFPPGQPLCGNRPHGIADADLDLSLGTGLTMRVRLELPPGDFPPATAGQPGVRLQFQLIDSDGTVAVLPGLVSTHPHVNRMYPPGEDWQTVTMYFDGFDSANDDAAVSGGVAGLQLDDIKAMQIIWRPGETSAWANVLHWDEITLIDDNPRLWADSDYDNDVDLADFAWFQTCFGADLQPTYPETTLFDFESGEQGWASYGVYTTDAGLLAAGSSGQGRYQVADFDIGTTGFGVVSVSPAIDLSAYTGLKFDARMVDVAGQPAFTGTREFNLVLGIGETEFSTTLEATQSFQTYEVAFADLDPPPAPFHLADPGMQIRLVVYAEGHTGVVELDHDEFIGVETVEHPCLPLDANYDGVIDIIDYTNFADCQQGSGVTTDFYGWCY